MYKKLRNLLDATAPFKNSAPKLGRGTLNIRMSRRISSVVAMIAASMMVIFGGVTAIAATSGNIVITTTNPNPPLDIETQNYASDAGVIGDQIIIKSNVALTGPVTATFAKVGGGTVAATVSPGGAGTFDTFTLTIPAEATTGSLTVLDSAAHNGVVAPFGIWASRSEPYTMPSGHINLTYGDLKYILDQIKFGEAHAARTSNATTVVANSYSNLNALAIKAGTPLLYNNTNARSIYPYDVLSATRCLQAVDLTAAATATYGQTALSNGYAYSNLDPWGVRQVDGECNNITNVVAEAPTTYTNTVPTKTDTAGWGASDQFFTRLSTATNKPGTTAPYTLSAAQKAYSNPTSYVKDAQPRLISNLISDQSSANPAAIAAGNYGAGTLYGGPINTEVSVNATNNDKVSTVVQIPNVTADYNVSAGYDSWFTLFGQFFDHGLDLIPKGGSQVFIPLDQSDPLYVQSDSAKNYMVLTRGSDSTGEQINITSPYVDQSQTYGSVASQNAWLREYAFTGAGGAPVATGGLIEGTDFYTRGDQHLGQATAVNGASGIALNGGLATWWDIKNQAYRMGFQLSDWDAGSIPVLATNQYGKIITGTNGFPLMLFKNASNQFLWVEGNKNAPIWTFPQVNVGGVNYGNAPGTLNGYYAVSTGHNFINDTMSSAVPAGGAGNKLIPDADNVINGTGSTPSGYYDNEALNEHFVAGDGRVNENIGLSAVHNTFHGEHNLLTEDIKNMLMNNPVIPASFLAEFLVNKNSTNASGDAAAGNWDGDRIYNAARYVCEMEYQHMVYDEFIRRISPGLPIFLAYQPTTRPDITQEFASAVYRLGHSMLNETIARSNPGTVWDPSNNQDVSLVTGFTNPSQARLARPTVISGAQANGSGNSIVYYLQTGTNEPLPEAGSVLSITGLTNSTLNIQNAVVASNNGSNTFTVNTYYQGGAASSPVSVSVAANASGSSKTYVLNTAANYDANWSTKEAQSTPGVVRVARASISNPGVGGYAYTPGESAAAIAQGMSQQRGNEIDEFTTDAVRNNLLGAPLDLPSLNLTRGRDTGLPTLNQFRATTGGALKPYKSWNDFIAALRYPESAVNFVAAYGTDPSISTKTIGSVTKVTSGPTLNTYTVSDIRGINVKDVVNISGFGTTARFNLQNAIVASVVDTDGNGPGNAGTFTVQKYYLTSPSAPTAFVKGAVVSGQDAGLTNLLKDVTPQALANVGTLSSTITKAGTVTRDTTIAERRAAALLMMANSSFMSSTGAWALKETGYNNIDLWIGGLAENPAKQPLTPPMLGPTFQYVFDKQALALQNGDRFYYLGRILGTNLNEEIPAQQLTDIVRRNTPSAGNSVIQPAGTTGLVGMNSPGFSVSDCFFSPDTSVPNSIDNSQGGNDFANNGMGNTACPANTMRDDNTNNVWIHDGLDNVVGFGDQNSTAGIRIAGGAGDDSIQGTSGNDYLSGGASGGDLIYGYVGDDVLIGGPGEDLIKGGAGNDVLDMGESQAGDIADGNSGADFIHNSNSTGVAASAIGEAGDDYIQGGTNNDALLEGGEGSDWIEGAGGLDVLNGDAGPNAALVDMLNGGDDVMDGGAGNDLINSDGGDDVVNLGDGSDLVGLGTGFDWVNYEATTRFDNGPAARPGVFIELAGGAIPNPTLMPVDAVLDSEGVSGSPGNDTIIGRQAQNQVLASTNAPITAASPANAVYGKAGLSWLTINATTTTIDGGMLVTGVGIPKGTQTVGPPALFTDATGLTTLQIVLTSPLTANVTGNVSFKVWPLKRAAGVKGLSDLIAGTPGATVGSIVPLTVAGEWTGGTLMVGGAGNDKLYAMGGSNVIHGSVQLHTCIVVTHNGAPFDKNFDTTCEGRNGYSGMTPLLDFMNSGEVNPKDLRVVKELVSTTQPIIGISSSGGQITYTTTNNTYGVGDLVTVNGLATPAWNVNRAAITAVTANTFTVAVAAATTGGTVGVTGTAVQSDDLYLPGLAAAYTIERLSVLPLGATSGYKITGPTGIDYVYDVQRIVFDSLANATPTPLVLGNNPAAVGNNTGFSAAATTLGITAGQLILSPAWDPSIHNYTAIASGASVTTAPTGTGSIWVNGLAKRGTTGTTTPTTLTLTGGAGTLVYNFGTATTNTYTVNIVAGGRVSTFDSPQSTGDGFTVNVTNCDKSQFTYTTSVPGGTASVGAQIGNNCEVTVSGLGTRQASTLAVTATPTTTFGSNPAGVGYVTGISSVGTAAPVVFDTPVGTSDGFTVNIISAVEGFTYLGEVVGTVDPANVSFGTIVNGVLPVTVSGMSPTEQGLLTVVASRTNFPTSSGSVLATAGGTIGAANVPTYGTPTGNSDGFTFHITNYNALFDYSFSVQALTSTTADVDLSDLANGNVTVNGLANGEAAMVTVGTSRSGYADGASTITYGATNNPGTQPTVSAVTKTADGFTFDITNYDDNALHYSLSTTVGSVDMVSTQIGVATVTVTGLTAGQAASVTISYTEPLRAVATKVVSDTAQGGPALTPVIVAGTPLANGFTFRVTNYDPLYTWNISATNGATVVGNPTVIGNTATYTMTGLNTNGTSVVTVETVRTNFGTGSATYTGSAFQSGLTVTRGATTKAATTTVQLANFDPTYTYVVSWSYTSALNVTTNGSAASISIATTGATAGRITITGVPAGARATGAVMRINVTTSKQYFTTVLTTLTF